MNMEDSMDPKDNILKKQKTDNFNRTRRNETVISSDNITNWNPRSVGSRSIGGQSERQFQEILRRIDIRLQSLEDKMMQK